MEQTKAYITNRMSVDTTVIEPPLEVVSITPTKDATVSLKNCIFNYGTMKEMLVCSSSTEAWQSLMTFDVPAITDEEVLANFQYAALELTLSSKTTRSATLALCFHDNPNWSETGITWANMPVDYYVYKTIEVAEGTGKISFDLTELIKQNSTSTTYAFTVKELSSEEQVQNIYIRTRESSSPPQLKYAYKFFPEHADVADLLVSAVVAKPAYSDLFAKAKIKNGMNSYDLPMRSYVIGYSDNVDIAVSCVVNSRGIDDLINTTAKVRLYDGVTDLPVKTTVYQKNMTDINTIATIPLRSDNADLNTIASVSRTLDVQIPVAAKVNLHDTYNDLPILAAVMKNDSEDISVISKVNSYNDAQDLPVSAYVHEAYTKNINVIARLSEKKINADLPILATVRRTDSSDIEVNAKVKAFNNSEDINVIAKIRAYDYLPANAVVAQKGTAEFNFTAGITPRYYKDLAVTVKVDRSLVKPYAFIM